MAGTTGVLNGTVTDAQSHAPIANALVTASAPTGTYKATTNGHGFYSMTGVYADTYTVSFQAPDYTPRSIPGVTLFADLAQTVDVGLSKEIKTIANITSRSQSSAFQPSVTTTTVTVSQAQIQNIEGSSFNTDEANLLVSLPGATLDSSGYPVIHGGREYEEDFQFEGIPYTDAYSNQFVNSLSTPTLGVASAQLTPGAGNATTSTNGTGSFNVVAKRGSYPAYGDFGIGIGGGAGFDHRFIADYSFATPDGRLSNYATFTGSNQTQTAYTDGLPLAEVGGYNDRRLVSNREFLDNLVYRFGHNNNQSLQAFTDVGETDFYFGAGGLAGLCFETCDPVITNFYGGIFGLSPAQMENMTYPYPGQTSPTETLVQGNRSPFSAYQPNAAFKLEYTLNINPSTYLSAEYYKVNSVATQDTPQTLGAISGDEAPALEGGVTQGGKLELQKQVNDKNLVQLGFDYHHVVPNDYWLSNTFQYLGSLIGSPDQPGTVYGFVSPTDPNCPLGADPSGTSYCGYAYNANPSATQLYWQPWLQVADVSRQDYSFYLNDHVDFSDRLKGDVGVRVDSVNYRMPTPEVDPYYCTTIYAPTSTTPNPNYNPNAPLGNGNCPFSATFNYGNQEFKPVVTQPRFGLSYRINNTTAIKLDWDRAVSFAPLGDVAFGDIRQSFYENAYGSLPAYNVFYNLANGLPAGAITPGGTASTHCGINLPGFLVPCKDFGEQLYWIAQNFDGIPFNPVKPMTSSNWQLTLSHQFTKGWLNGVAASIAPWTRHQYDTIAQQANLVLGANGQPLVLNGSLVQTPPVFSNNAKEYATGIDLNVTREARYGWSGQFTASYVNEFSSVIPLSASEDFYPNIPSQSLQLGNVYRVGFVSPLSTTLGLTYATHNGWKINPRVHYDIGYPFGQGSMTAATVNGVNYNIPNTDGVVGVAPNGPYGYVDPMNPGSVFNPNLAATSGFGEKSQPGGKLSPANSTTDITISYEPVHSNLTYGLNVGNLFDQYYDGPEFNARYQPIATGVSGPLTGYSSSGTNYSGAPYANPYYVNQVRGQQLFVNFPDSLPRNFYFFVQAKI